MRRVPLKSRQLALVATVALVPCSAFAQADKKPVPAEDKAAKPAETKADAEEAPVDPFKIPEGNDPKVLQEFLARLAKTSPEKRTLQGRRDHVRKIDNLVIEVMKRDLDEATAMNCVDLRFGILRYLESAGDETATADRKKFIDGLLTSKIPKVAERGNLFQMAERVNGLSTANAEARKKLVDDVTSFISGGTLSEEKLQFAQQTPEILASLGDNELAVAALNKFAASFEARKDERLTELIESLRSTGRRLGLPGHPIEVKGKTVDGKDFDITSLKGKVVLVDFWATWCGPCMAEMPNVKAAYDAYKDRGFDVVGVSLDEKREVLQKFLASSELPWTQLYQEEEGAMGWSNPIVRKYGITGIPTAILVGKDGNVVSLNAHGRELSKLLEKLLGPADAKAEAPAKEK